MLGSREGGDRRAEGWRAKGGHQRVRGRAGQLRPAAPRARHASAPRCHPSPPWKGEAEEGGGALTG